MSNCLGPVDCVMIASYLLAIMGIGLYLSKRATQSLEDYFLAGRSLPWWALGISGMAMWLDVTGTMIITSFLYMLGPRGLYIEFRGGAVLIAAVAMVYAGKWHRRSQCITGPEWIKFRFGEDKGSQFARIVSAVFGILSTAMMLSYMIKGVGLFFSMFLPFTPIVCSIIVVVVAAIYTMMSGFYGVVVTDIFQSCIILVGVVIVSVMGFMKVVDENSLARIAEEVVGNTSWTGALPSIDTEMPKGYEMYRCVLMYSIFYFLRNLIAGMGGGAEPKYFAARNDRDCGTLTLVNVLSLTMRWPMMMGFAILGIFAVKGFFPDQGVLVQAAEMIKQFVGDVGKAQWPEIISRIINHSDNYPVELIAGLKDLLGQKWDTTLLLLSYEGNINPERILPTVILTQIPMGVRGLLIVALVAASMSSFDSNINMATGFFVRDIYERFIKKASVKRVEFLIVSWIFIIALASTSFIFAYRAKSINDIWGWIIMGFGAGGLAPAFLRLYWWRLNGITVALSGLIGMIAAMLQRLIWPEMSEIYQFCVMLSISVISTVVITFMTKPTDEEVLKNFYVRTRPFGFWGRFKKMLPEAERIKTEKEHYNDIVALPFALLWQITLFLLPMLFLIKAYESFAVTLVVFLFSLAGLIFFWYRNLPEKNNYEDIEVK